MDSGSSKIGTNSIMTEPKYRKYTASNLEDAIAAVQDGTAIFRASRMYNIPYNTLRRYVKGSKSCNTSKSDRISKGDDDYQSVIDTVYKSFKSETSNLQEEEETESQGSINGDNMDETEESRNEEDLEAETTGTSGTAESQTEERNVKKEVDDSDSQESGNTSHHRNSDGKYKQYNTNGIKQAIDAVHTDGISLYKASQIYKVPYNTLRRHAKGMNSGKMGQRRILSDEQESYLVGYATYLSEMSIPPDRKLLLTMAKELDARFNGKFSGKKPSNGWWTRFVERNPHLLVHNNRLPESPSFVSTSNHLNMIKSVIQLHDLGDKPPMIFYAALTEFKDKDKKAVVDESTLLSNTTVSMCVSASGQVIPPCVTFTNSSPSSGYTEQGPEGAMYDFTDTGSINSEIFSEWFKDKFLQQIPNDRPVMLIMRNHSCYMSLDLVESARENDVIFFYLSAYSSNIMNPLDQVFDSMKESFTKLALRSKGESVTKETFPAVLKQAMDDSLSTAKIQSSFDMTGIFPSNADPTDYSDVPQVLHG